MFFLFFFKKVEIFGHLSSIADPVFIRLLICFYISFKRNINYLKR
ncbi:hypothetical protein Mpsy_2202 [Methanolobus psychrophilus R15]|nr:hypothetical protein Mpsy_2202 [Methanolobus psychrophilus R15]